MFQHILGKFSIIKNLSIKISDVLGKKYELDIFKGLTSFALNVQLVIDEKRLAYRVDTLDYDMRVYLIDIVKKYNPDIISISVIKEEPLLILKKNSREVINTFKNVKTNEEFNIAFGKVLGYLYVSPVLFLNTNYHTVFYKATDRDNISFCIHGFTIPLDKYDDIIKSQIFEKVKSYSEVLENYGYNISIEVLSRNDHDVKMLDYLP